MSYGPEQELLAHALARARMPVPRSGRPARRIAMAAKHRYARQLGHW